MNASLSKVIRKSAMFFDCLIGMGKGALLLFCLPVGWVFLGERLLRRFAQLSVCLMYVLWFRQHMDLAPLTFVCGFLIDLILRKIIHA